MIEGKHIRLRLVEEEDSQYILLLRADEKLNKYVSKVDVILQNQIDWIKKYKEREKAKQEYYFIIEDTENNRLGTVRLYDFKGDSFCWGSWIISKGAANYIAIESALAVYELAFFKLGFEKSHFDVRKGNDKVIKFHLRFGAEQIDEDDLDLFFVFPKSTYIQTKEKYKRFLPVK